MTTGLTNTRSSPSQRAHEEPPQDPDLRRREAHAFGVVHEADHPLRHAPELLVEGLDLLAAHAQHGIPVLPDLRERDVSADEPLGLGARLGLRQLAVVSSS